MASDRSTMELRRGLARGNWRVHPWEMGVNTGAKEDTLEKPLRTIARSCWSGGALVEFTRGNWRGRIPKWCAG
jgi:hypothetical protein